MKKIRTTFCVLLFCLGAGGLLPSTGICDCSLTLGWENYPPYQSRDGQGHFSGLDLDIVKQIMEKVHCKIHYIEMPWTRIVKSVQHGQIDFTAGASKNAEREAYAYFSEVYRQESFGIYIRQGEQSKYTIDQLSDIEKRNYKLGVVRGYYYGEEYDSLSKRAEFMKHVNLANKESQNISMLLHYKLDCILIDPFVAAYKFKKMKLGNKIVAYPKIIHHSDIYAMFSKKTVTPDIVEAFNTALMKMKADGTHQHIIDMYLGY